MNEESWNRRWGAKERRHHGRRSPLALAMATGAALLLACGGSGTPSGTGTVSGTAVKGPVQDATVTAFAISNGAKGSTLGSATTDASGVDALKAKAGEAHAALDGLNMNISPTASLASLDAIIAKAREARAELASIGSGGGGAQVSTQRTFMPAKVGDRFQA